MKLKYDWLYFDFLLNAVKYTSWTAGFNYDPGQRFITADFLKAQQVPYGNFSALMLAGGYRFDDRTPYARYSLPRQDNFVNLGSFGTFPKVVLASCQANILEQ